MPTPPTDRQLLAFSEEHLMHELSMLWETAHALPQHQKGTTEYTALLESFATHLRNLIDFFYFGPDKDYVRAHQFLEDPTAWAPAMPAEVKQLLGRANNEVSHLTLNRVDGDPPEKEWRTEQILGLTATVAKDFASKASAKKLHPKVREFLQLPPDKAMVWIGDNVRHPNVASHTLTSTISANFSTATVITRKGP